MDRLSNLPSETLWKILSYLTVHDLSCIRMTNRKLAVFADHPSHWRHLHLAPPSHQYQNQHQQQDQRAIPSSNSMTLWSLKDLQRLVGPHRKIIESIQIWGVRDNILRYILSQCMNLTDLTVCGWATLSDHAFKQLHPDLNLQRLVLIGAQEQPNYTALDATTLAHLLVQCPLKELSLGCQIHIHAETLIMELNKRQKQYRRQQQQQSSFLSPSSTLPTTPTAIEKQPSSPPPLIMTSLPLVKHTASTYSTDRRDMSEVGSPIQLQRFTLATQRTWSTDLVTKIFDTCPSLHHVCLFPAAATSGFDFAQTKKMCHNMDQQHLPMNNSADNVADTMVHQFMGQQSEELPA